RIAGRVDDSAILTYDQHGQLVQLARFDTVGDITSVRTYDPPGKRYTERNLDGTNHLDGCGGVDLSLDGRGRVLAETCLQWLGEPMRDTNGVTTSKYQRDDSGLITREERFDPQGAAMAGVRDAVHRIDTERDAQGRVKVERFYDITGAPTPSAEERGCYGVARDYERGLEVRRRCLAADGLPRRDTDGVATFETERDDRGCEVGERHLGANGEPVLRDGVAGFAYKVDRRCFTLEKRCLDKDDDLTACAPGEPAAFIHKRDRQGRVVSSRFLDEYGDPTGDADYDVAEVRYKWDALGRQIGESCHDLRGGLVECSRTGFARTADTFDDNGRIAERRFYGPDGEPASNRGTVARKYVYDNYDHLAETRNLDEDGGLFESDGMAIKRNYYDDTHLLFGIALLDARERPADYTACFTGVTCPPNESWHAVRIVRSPDGRATYNHYFDHVGRKIMTLDCKRDQCWGVD
ncbi:MAG: hypothetical protein K8M05_23815, partial [Deltaproteobacteria bacterium]|nr:hypothetical protein [Kofleriaceae bacterium]